ncbi:autotransporter domain-containing protein [Achromobacter kerstersii]
MPRKRSLVVAMAAVCGLFGYLPAAQATCSPGFSTGATVICTGFDFSLNSSVSNMNVMVASGAEVNVILGDPSALTLSGNNTRFTNLGTVQPSGNPSTMLASGVTIGNANNSIVSVTNLGVIKGTVGVLGVNLPTVQGVALNIQNGAFGTTTVTNSGTISSMPLLAISMATADAPVVAISGGGQVSMTNTGIIAGRVAFEASAVGNEFTNAGTIVGSVSLGAGKGTNQFTAITGSWVDQGAGMMDALPVQNSTMAFAKAGLVDGGVGGNNTLTLQNAIGGGSGTAGSGSISSANYVNFNNLIVTSGTWNLSGPVLTGTTTTTTLNGGRLTVDNAAALGPGTVTANGGDLLAGASSLTLSNAVVLAPGGLTVSGSNALILGGVLSGAGSLTKSGLGTLALQADNTYAGTTTVSGGILQLGTGGTTGSLGTGAIVNNGQVVLVRSNNATLSNAFSGAGTIVKNSTGVASLTGDSSAFTGSTTVSSGGLTVSNKLGGDVTVSPGATLAGSGTISGNVGVSGGTLQGTQGQTLTIGGNLDVSDAQINVALGAAGSSAALVDVGGNLTLAGTLNVTDSGGFGAGIYRLFDYGGNLVDNGLTVGATPAGVAAGALTLQTAVRGQVNLASTSGATLSFWDGSNTARHDNGVIDGGSGTWRADGRNWANMDGTLNGVFQPNPTFAIFQGTAGTVTVDNSAGAIGVTGMQIVTDGYRIQGDDIALQGSGGESIIRVGAGSSADAATTGTIASRLTGASKLAKTDYGTLVLTADNTYTGGTDVRLGALSVAKDANLGAAAGGLTLSGGVLATTASFDTNRAVSITRSSGIDVASGTTFGLAGAITGSGDVTKTGAGMLTVSGDGSAYTGNALVQSGVLNIASTGKLGGTLTLANGALLQGAGQVGATTLQSGAILAPGNVNGTLNVAGDLTFMPGSVYQVAADPASSASARVVVNGVANLAGSVVHVGPEGGFESTRQYTILTAGAINGQFNTVSSNYAFLDPALRYGAQDVTLQLGRKQVQGDPATPSRPIAFADAARTGNQRAVANALDSLPSGNALHEYILTLPEGAPAAAFNSLSGEAHASVASSLMGSINTVRTLPLSHLRANLNAGMRPGAPTAQAGGTLSASALPSSNAQPAWAELVGNWQTQNATDNTAQVRQHTGGVFAGADHAVGNGWRVGGAVGYTDSKIRVDDLASKADVSGYSAAIYGGKSFDAGAGKLNLLVGTSYTWHDVNTERYATVAGASQKLTADYGASTTQLFNELGYAMPLSDRTTLEPFAGVAWSDLRSRSFQETGGSAALTGQSSSDKQTSSTLGVRAQTDFTLAGAEGRLRGTLGWRHAFGDVLPQSTMAFDGGQAFTVAGAPIARNAAVAELGAEVAVSRNASLGLNYSGQYGGGNREHAGSLNVRWRY